MPPHHAEGRPGLKPDADLDRIDHERLLEELRTLRKQISKKEKSLIQLRGQLTQTKLDHAAVHHLRLSSTKKTSRASKEKALQMLTQVEQEVRDTKAAMEGPVVGDPTRDVLRSKNHLDNHLQTMTSDELKSDIALMKKAELSLDLEATRLVTQRRRYDRELSEMRLRGFTPEAALAFREQQRKEQGEEGPDSGVAGSTELSESSPGQSPQQTPWDKTSAQRSLRMMVLLLETDRLLSGGQVQPSSGHEHGPGTVADDDILAVLTSRDSLLEVAVQRLRGFAADVDSARKRRNLSDEELSTTALVKAQSDAFRKLLADFAKSHKWAVELAHRTRNAEAEVGEWKRRAIELEAALAEATYQQGDSRESEQVA